QSIRTMARAFDAGRSYLKLSLNIIQTSTSRYLSPHSVASASAVSEWLLRIVAGDAFLKEKLELLLEYAGVVYDPPPLDESIELRTYGTLACIWRENIASKLKQDEQAIPFNALFADNDDGTPFLQGWLGETPDIDS